MAEEPEKAAASFSETSKKLVSALVHLTSTLDKLRETLEPSVKAAERLRKLRNELTGTTKKLEEVSLSLNIVSKHKAEFIKQLMQEGLTYNLAMKALNRHIGGLERQIEWYQAAIAIQKVYLREFEDSFNKLGKTSQNLKITLRNLFDPLFKQVEEAKAKAEKFPVLTPSMFLWGKILLDLLSLATKTAREGKELSDTLGGLAIQLGEPGKTIKVLGQLSLDAAKAALTFANALSIEELTKASEELASVIGGVGITRERIKDIIPPLTEVAIYSKVFGLSIKDIGPLLKMNVVLTGDLSAALKKTSTDLSILIGMVDKFGIRVPELMTVFGEDLYRSMLLARMGARQLGFSFDQASRLAKPLEISYTVLNKTRETLDDLLGADAARAVPGVLRSITEEMQRLGRMTPSSILGFFQAAVPGFLTGPDALAKLSEMIDRFGGRIQAPFMQFLLRMTPIVTALRGLSPDRLRGALMLALEQYGVQDLANAKILANFLQNNQKLLEGILTGTVDQIILTKQLTPGVARALALATKDPLVAIKEILERLFRFITGPLFALLGGGRPGGGEILVTPVTGIAPGELGIRAAGSQSLR